jgi:low affinity Fe/Cu permease
VTQQAPAAPKNGTMTVSSVFGRFARATSRIAGRPTAFALAVLLIVGWAVSGPIFGYSEGWQLVINTTTTIVTFLMVFLMQSTQNRDTEALQLKIDELIRAIDEADNSVIALDEAEEPELAAARANYLALANGEGTAAANEAGAGAAAEVKPPTSRRRGARAPRP